MAQIIAGKNGPALLHSTAMKKLLLRSWFAFTFSLAASILPGFTAEPATSPGKIRILLVAGGHEYEREPFLDLFRSLSGITFQHVEHPQAQAWFKPASAASYDVVVLYDMWQKIDGETKTNFVNLLKAGKGLVVMHHAIANYSDWDQYAEIVGAKYYLQEMTVQGAKKAPSLWKHDVEFTVKIADPEHPVTRGLKDFAIHDETYNLFDVHEGVKPLLTTTESTSGKTIAWAKEYEKSRVVYLQLGHDHLAYENPNLRQLVQQAIGWVAKKN
jgi:uncharacterized protein